MARYEYVIVGAGMIADAAAKGIRELDPDSAILILGDEADEPYTRPALSKLIWTDPSFTVDKVPLGTEATGAEIRTGFSSLCLPGLFLCGHAPQAEVLLHTGGVPLQHGLHHPDVAVHIQGVGLVQLVQLVFKALDDEVHGGLDPGLGLAEVLPLHPGGRRLDPGGPGDTVQ